jgi:hypothetical protein
MRLIRIFILLVFSPGILSAQSLDSTERSIQKNKRQLKIATISAAATYGVSLAVLNHAWYKDSRKQSFRFFNDNAEWKQVDKLGHFYSAFYLSYGIGKGLTRLGVGEQKSDLVGALTGFAVLVPIEIFDGFSEAYGASTGDLVADAAGSFFYESQKLLWKELRVYPKFSFHTTSYATRRPDVLGVGAERLLKDYNGQTYWLTFDTDKFIKFPKWLNLSVGYGAHRMMYARDLQQEMEGLPPAYRQYYFSLDLDLTSIQTRSKVLKTIFFALSIVKIPAPTLEYSQRTFRFHPLYF